jgi:hypothetical protein
VWPKTLMCTRLSRLRTRAWLATLLRPSHPSPSYADYVQS